MDNVNVIIKNKQTNGNNNDIKWLLTVQMHVQYFDLGKIK